MPHRLTRKEIPSLKNSILTYARTLVAAMMIMVAGVAYGQEKSTTISTDSTSADAIIDAREAQERAVIDSLEAHERPFLAPEDSLAIEKAAKKERKKRDWATWKPDPKRATWLALIIPGAGQIYNRKYWKLPIVYGGFVGCAYAMRWNNQMYTDYAQAYIDLMDSNPETKSYEKFLHLGRVINDSNKARYQQIFKSRKDKYRHWRDMSFFCLLGVYALSVIDAYVDASLSQFDISDDLSLHVEPGFIGNGSRGNQRHNMLQNTGIGVQCSLQF